MNPPWSLYHHTQSHTYTIKSWPPGPKACLVQLALPTRPRECEQLTAAPPTASASTCVHHLPPFDLWKKHFDHFYPKAPIGQNQFIALPAQVYTCFIHASPLGSLELTCSRFAGSRQCRNDRLSAERQKMATTSSVSARLKMSGFSCTSKFGVNSPS